MLIINVIPHTVLGHKASEEINSVLKVQSPKTVSYTQKLVFIKTLKIEKSVINFELKGHGPILKDFKHNQCGTNSKRNKTVGGSQHKTDITTRNS